ncbi:MAG TPA: entericidin A/B family lipoprotein [Trinickia sp.]|nr:entericidin A/B family lipoprotein [Trinickia sp.]
MTAWMFWRRAAWVALAGALLGLAGCNTVAGFGQDMSDAGHALRKAAE